VIAKSAKSTVPAAVEWDTVKRPTSCWAAAPVRFTTPPTCVHVVPFFEKYAV
jgi:hypothetical protein